MSINPYRVTLESPAGTAARTGVAIATDRTAPQTARKANADIRFFPLERRGKLLCKTRSKLVVLFHQ
jgi:hypothetical protein